MAEIITGKEKIGYGVMVVNTKKEPAEKDTYISVYFILKQFKIKGHEEKTYIGSGNYMFTNAEFRKFFFKPYECDPKDSSQNDTSFITDFPGTIGWMYQGCIYGTSCFVGNMHWVGETRCVKIPLRVLIRAKKRSLKNIEDITKVSKFELAKKNIIAKFGKIRNIFEK